MRPWRPSLNRLGENSALGSHYGERFLSRLRVPIDNPKPAPVVYPAPDQYLGSPADVKWTLTLARSKTPPIRPLEVGPVKPLFEAPCFLFFARRAGPAGMRLLTSLVGVVPG